MDMREEKIDGVLEMWEFHDTYPNSLVGIIFGDRKGRFQDGTYVITSRVRGAGPDGMLERGDIVTTMNSTYKLGRPACQK